MIWSVIHNLHQANEKQYCKQRNWDAVYFSLQLFLSSNWLIILSPQLWKKKMRNVERWCCPIIWITNYFRYAIHHWNWSFQLIMPIRCASFFGSLPISMKTICNTVSTRTFILARLYLISTFSDMFQCWAIWKEISVKFSKSTCELRREEIPLHLPWEYGLIASISK